MNLYRSQYVMLVAIFGLMGCAGAPQDHAISNQKTEETSEYVENDLFSRIAAATNPLAKDRAAILAMQGEYKVEFDFQETVVLRANYERWPRKQATAYETVLVVEDSPDKIVLQHILVSSEGDVIKHWRQDWHLNSTQRLVFSDNQHWELQAIPLEKDEDLWTQCVYEVSDAPRYCGTGHWEHHLSHSAWMSDQSWRPLPRREYTVREDYNVLSAINRHTITETGWTHEQDNSKVLRDNGQITSIIVKEFGFNDYRRISGLDFSPAYRYWKATAAYWQKVRLAWSQYLERDQFISLATENDGMPIIVATFGQASEVDGGAPVPSVNEISELLAPWINVKANDSGQFSAGSAFRAHKKQGSAN